jgi:hypothetical protein
LNKNLKRLATVSYFLENPTFDIHTFYTENELSDEEVQHKQMDLYNGKPILEIIDLSKTYADSSFFGNLKSINALKVKELIKNEVISDGMLPKVESALEAVASGVEHVQIIDGTVDHAVLLELFTDEGIGTMIRRK